MYVLQVLRASRTGSTGQRRAAMLSTGCHSHCCHQYLPLRRRLASDHVPSAHSNGAHTTCCHSNERHSVPSVSSERATHQSGGRGCDAAEHASHQRNHSSTCVTLSVRVRMSCEHEMLLYVGSTFKRRHESNFVYSNDNSSSVELNFYHFFQRLHCTIYIVLR